MMTYFKEIATGFWSLLAGMAVTIRYFVKPVVTVQYPRQKIQMSPRYRGYPQFILDPDTQTHRCIACEMCSRICPSQLITVEGAKFPGEKQKRAPGTSTSTIIAVSAACASRSAPPRPWNSPRNTGWWV